MKRIAFSNQISEQDPSFFLMNLEDVLEVKQRIYFKLVFICYVVHTFIKFRLSFDSMMNIK